MTFTVGSFVKSSAAKGCMCLERTKCRGGMVMKLRTLKTYLMAGLLAALGQSGCSQKSLGQASAPVSVVASENQTFKGLDAEILRVDGFPEPFVRLELGQSTFPQIIEQYRADSRPQSQKIEILEKFLVAHPKDSWGASARLNLGIYEHLTGRFTPALANLKQACWYVGFRRSAVTPRQRERCANGL